MNMSLGIRSNSHEIRPRRNPSENSKRVSSVPWDSFYCDFQSEFSFWCLRIEIEPISRMLASVNTSVDRSKLKCVGTLRDPVCTQIANAKTNRLNWACAIYLREFGKFLQI